MIKLSDTTLLAFTKLRTRKIRTIITILLASLLFGVLVAASLVMTGVLRSVEAFREDGLTSRYIVSVFNAPGDPLALQKLLRDPKLIAQAKDRYEKLVDEKKAEATKLGITYNQASDQPPYSISTDGTERLSINDQNGIVHDILKEKFSGDPAFDDKKLESVAKEYGAIKTFTEEGYYIARGSSLITFKDGKEVFYDQSDEAETNANYTTPLIDPTRMTVTPPEIADSFLLPNNAGWQPDGKSLPIILPQNIVEQVLGLEKLPATASASEKLDRLKTVRDKAKDLSFQACYRNAESQARIQSAIQQKKEIAANKDKNDYEEPKIIEVLPDPTKCEDVTYPSNTSSDDSAKDKQAIFDQRFGKDATPVSYFVSFKVVGVSPAEAGVQRPDQQSDDQIRSLEDVVSNLLKTSSIGQAIPKTLYDQLPDKTKYANLFTYTPTYLFGNEDNKHRFVEFASASDAAKFIDEQSCTMSYDNTCQPLGRPYQASLAFSNSSALDDIQNTVKQWFTYAMLGVIVLAAAIMWITIGRTVADGRHETAVFRAIGFKRIDITMVYALYTVILSVMVAAFATGVGWVGASILNQRFSSDLTAQAQYGFGGLDMTKEISLIGVDQEQLLILLVACIATGILSSIVPLLLNVRRSPIRDMREE